jgi:hypothetical protein
MKPEYLQRHRVWWKANAKDQSALRCCLGLFKAYRNAISPWMRGGSVPGSALGDMLMYLCSVSHRFGMHRINVGQFKKLTVEASIVAMPDVFASLLKYVQDANSDLFYFQRWLSLSFGVVYETIRACGYDADAVWEAALTKLEGKRL